MAWTQADIDKLKSAIGLGVRRVRYASGETEYQSIDDMRKLLADMEREVNPGARPTRTVARFERGF